jgi:hypothetical protein
MAADSHALGLLVEPLRLIAYPDKNLSLSTVTRASISPRSTRRLAGVPIIGEQNQ